MTHSKVEAILDKLEKGEVWEESYEEWSAWQPIETAPNNERILVAYDDGNMSLIQAEDNDYTWKPYRGERILGITTPTHWQYPPEGPK